MIGQSHAQKEVNHFANFNSGVQNMWGPSFSPITLDQTITLFNVPWNVSFNTGNAGIISVAGLNFGGAFSGSFSGSIGSTIEIKGFTTGTVEVDYPVDIELEMNEDEEYDQGDDVFINTSYSVRPGWELETLYPSAGEIIWDLNFQFAASASATLCAFGCVTIPVIPNFNTGLQSLNLVTISGNGASTGGANGVWYLGPANNFGPNQPPAPAGGIWPYAKPPATSTQLSGGPGIAPNNWIPWQVHIGAFPMALPDAGFGLTGEVTIPHVDTDPTLDTGDNTLRGCGDSTYLNLNLEIFKVLGAILSEVPEPITQGIGNVLSNLSGSESFGIAEISWNFFSASFDVNITNKQCFDFEPRIYGRFEFPVAVPYQIERINGTTTALTTGSIINFEVGDRITYKFPCYFDSLAIVPTYSIDGQFTNHTYDSVSFDFLMSAFAFGIDVPAVTVIPGFTIPQICVNLPYPCPSWSNPFRICWSNVCTPQIVVPPIGFPGFNLTVGPLFSDSIPLGGFTYDWFNQTWELEGFQDTTFNSFFMRPYKLGISNTFINIACNDGSDGSINVVFDAFSHDYPYNLTWTNGINSAVNTSTHTHSNLEAGPHILTAIDGNGCQLVTGATLIEPQPLLLSNTKIDKSCNSGANDGSITLTVTGGTAPYTYVWSNGASGVGLNSISNLPAGSYTVTVTDNNLCAETLTIEVTEPLLLGHNAVTTDVLCFGNTSGGIDVNTFGGSLPYTFSWSNGASTEDIVNIGAGTYDLEITDINGCQSLGSYSIIEPAQPLNITLSQTPVSCFAGNDGTVASGVTGGSAPYTYQWSSDQTVLPFTTASINGLIAGNYTVTITDVNNCSLSETISVPQPLSPIEQNPIIVDILCSGDVTGSISTNVSGGTPGYVYNWNTGATSADLINTGSGVYTLIVSDLNGCQETYEYTISEPSAPISISLTSEDVKCFGENTGLINAVVQGGTAPYVYSWSNGGSTASIDQLVAGGYTLDITDANGCTETASITITEPVAPVSFSTVVVDVDCHGNASGSIDLTVNGGTSPYTYQWTNLSSFILTDTTQDISNQLSGEYSVLITDANGCQETALATINQPLSPLSLSGVVTDIDCFGLSEGIVNLTVSGGSGGYAFLWSDGSTNQDLINVTAGNYSVTVTDMNGCQIQTSFEIEEPTSPLSIVLSSQDAKCNGESSGSAQSIVTGGTAPYTYNWSNGSTNNSIINVSANTYTLTVTDANGCTSFSGTTVGEPTELLLTTTITDVSCYEYSDGEVVVDIQGGVQPYSFTWGNQNSIVLNNPSETLSGLVASDYLVRVRDANNCIAEVIVTVNQPSVFEAELSIMDVTCFDGTDGSIDMDLVGGTLPYSTVWNNGASTSDIANLAAGVYTYVTTDGQGCEIRGEGEVIQPSEINITYQIIPVSCIDQSDASIDVSGFGGTPPFQYLWENGEQGSVIEELAPGIYELTVTDDNNCENTFEFDVNGAFDECLIIPNTFTPNGDNYNDTWVLENLNLYQTATVKVFNRWGNEIFNNNQNAYVPWDGTDNGNALPAGVYYYIIILNNEQSNQYTGTVTIVR